jgi:hypothetical protein
LNAKRKRNTTIPQGRKTISLSLNRLCQVGEGARVETQITHLSAVTIGASAIVTTVDNSEESPKAGEDPILLMKIDTTDVRKKNPTIIVQDVGIAAKEAEIGMIVTDPHDGTDEVTVEIATEEMIGIGSRKEKMFMKLFTLTFRKTKTKLVLTVLKSL